MLNPDRTVMGKFIAKRLREDRDRLTDEFRSPGKVPTFAIENVLPSDWAAVIHDAFPSQDRMTFKNSIKERKHVAAQMNEHPPILEEIVYAFQEPTVLEIITEITGIVALEPDVDLYAGGISTMVKGSYLKPHLDNSHDAQQERYRVLNLLYYVTPGWRPEYGGSLEVWDDGPTGRPRPFPPLFNRLVVMATNRTSWHSVSEISADARRCCISNYYFSKLSPEAADFFHATSFRGRPGERLKDFAMRADNALRTTMLKVTRNNSYRSALRYKRD